MSLNLHTELLVARAWGRGLQGMGEGLQGTGGEGRHGARGGASGRGGGLSVLCQSTVVFNCGFYVFN